MKRLVALLTALPVFGAITFTASEALADSYATGGLTNVASLTASSDYYPYYRGWVYLNSQYYLWGGSYCSSYSYTPSATDIQLLTEALINRKNVGIYYKQGTYYPCITGVVLLNTTATTSTNATPAGTNANPAPPIAQ
jgi:hypothetical protein